jgi:branched-chain amino acid transport system ATP-binding protein
MTAIIELKNLRKSFGHTEIICGVNLDIRENERHAIIGPNGAGKSTLFNLISGRYSVTSGRVFLHKQDITNKPPYEVYRMGLSRSFQVTNIFHRMSVFENVRCAILWRAGYKYSFWHSVDNMHEVNARTEEILTQINLLERRHLPAGVLTYAEQRALELGITIAGGADVIMLDEPTSGMSRSETEQTVELIRRITAGKTLVIIEHDMGVVFNLADRISVLVYGEIIASDVPANVRGNPLVQEAYLGTEDGDNGYA